VSRLRGAVAIVTGASSGFGWAIAKSLAAEGATVGLVARRADRLEALETEIKEAGGTALVCPADVSSEQEILAVVEQVEEACGSVTLLVNNAGTNVATRSITDTDVQAWRMILEVNLTSAYIFTKAVLPAMMQQEHGTIVNIASKAANNPSLIAGVAYSSSKRGMEALTVVTNQEANLRNVRATVLNPGEGNTPILDRRSVPPSAESRSAMIQPQDLADLVVLVATLPQTVTIETVDLRPTRKRLGP
jgi:NADP-dependent 3-hydroxy acid dehydrogenase YdfG